MQSFSLIIMETMDSKVDDKVYSKVHLPHAETQSNQDGSTNAKAEKGALPEPQVLSSTYSLHYKKYPGPGSLEGLYTQLDDDLGWDVANKHGYENNTVVVTTTNLVYTNFTLQLFK